MPQFERRFIELRSHSVFQIEGSEPGSQRTKKLAVKTRLQIRYPQNSLDAQNTQTLDKKKKIRQQVIQHYPVIRKQLAILKGNLSHTIHRILILRSTEAVLLFRRYGYSNKLSPFFQIPICKWPTVFSMPDESNLGLSVLGYSILYKVKSVLPTDNV